MAEKAPKAVCQPNTVATPVFRTHGQSEKPKSLSNSNKKYPAYIPGTRNKKRTHTVALIPPVEPTYHAMSFGGLFHLHSLQFVVTAFKQ